MSLVDEKLKDMYLHIIEEGESKSTRTGNVISVWDKRLEFDLSKEFPAVTNKKFAMNSCFGELLYFLSGSTSLEVLKHYTFNDQDSGKWTIWTNDAERWGGKGNIVLGNLYPHQWRSYGSDYNLHTPTKPVDQIKNLIDRLKSEPDRRDHIVMAWNPYEIENDLMALKPCHLGFQCYVNQETGKLNLKFWQRSVDSFLGLPFNIASYALLTHLLAKWTGYEVGTLSCDLGDVHVYENHMDAIFEFINNETHVGPTIQLPKGTDTLESTLELTALDFKGCLKNYTHSGVIKAPLSVG
jgi:thymidylate synthase